MCLFILKDFFFFLTPVMEWQTDKASMLDEIIDYVKFLQLQVKAIFPEPKALLKSAYRNKFSSVRICL